MGGWWLWQISSMRFDSSREASVTTTTCLQEKRQHQQDKGNAQAATAPAINGTRPAQSKKLECSTHCCMSG
jgi:hypothetical protein